MGEDARALILPARYALEEAEEEEGVEAEANGEAAVLWPGVEEW